MSKKRKQGKLRLERQDNAGSHGLLEERFTRGNQSWGRKTRTVISELLEAQREQL